MSGEIARVYWLCNIRTTSWSDVSSKDQKKYINDLLSKFEMSQCNSVSTPIEVGLKLKKSEKED